MAKKKELDKLSLDVIECEKAGFGCHYGAWKATQKPVPPPERKVYSKQTVCRYCGKTFLQIKGGKRQYCDDYCRYEASKERDKEKRTEYMKKYWAERSGKSE